MQKDIDLDTNTDKEIISWDVIFLSEKKTIQTRLWSNVIIEKKNE